MKTNLFSSNQAEGSPAARHSAPAIRPVFLAVLLLLLGGKTASAQTFNGLKYSVTTSNTVTITGYTVNPTVLVIPDAIAGLPVTTIGNYAFANSAVTSVTIPASLTSIQSNAFYQCTSLVSGALPAGVTSIGYGAFAYTALTNLLIPANLTSIGDGAFGGCTALGAIQVDPLNPAYVSVDGVLFNPSQTTLIQCPARKANAYTIPVGVTNIGIFAFFNCYYLTDVILPAGLTSIGHSAFYGCESLNSMTIPNGVTTIGSYAFDDLYVTSVALPDSLTDLGEGAFYDCESLAQVSLSGNLTRLGAQVFAYCYSLTDLTIPSSVTSIGDYAFMNSGLTSITIPRSVTNIGVAPFSVCQSLPAIQVAPLNPAYRAVGGILFDQNQTTLIQCAAATSLKTFTIPGTVTGIGEGAFYYCQSLTSVTIPDSVIRIGASAFEVCRGLTNAPLPAGLLSLGDLAFAFSAVTNVAIPGGLTSIGNSVFTQAHLGSVTIPDGVTSIGTNAFKECHYLRSVQLPNRLTTLGSQAFMSCPLTNLTIPGSVTSIGAAAFFGCGSLTNAYFQGNAPTVDVRTFYGTPMTARYLPGTTGWSTNLGDAPTSVWVQSHPEILYTSPQMGLNSNGFGFPISWASNATVVVQASTTLAPGSWSPISTNTLSYTPGSTQEGNGWTTFTDPAAANQPSRFYRLAW